MDSVKSPQELINQFWERTVSFSTNPCVTTTLPQSIFAQGFQDQVPPKPGVAESVMADYDRAVQKCIAKVEKISKECRHANQKYTDPSFNLWDFGYCLRPLSTYVPPEKDPAGDESADEAPNPPRMTLYVDDKPAINLTQFIAPQNQASNEEIEESPGAQPQSVKRVRQIFDTPQFFVDGATADDIRQGVAGDCWFLSALSALCCMEPKELGNLVERVCVKRDEAVGVYGFVFFRDGEWRSEIIDDKLYLTAPDYKNMDYSSEMDYLLKYIKEKDRAEQYRKIVQSNSEALYYAKSAHKSETWVPLIEKAYAKAHGDFTAIGGGLIADGIEDLTGGLSTFFITEDIVDLDRFWDEGLAQVNNSFLWGCSTSKINEQDKRGLAGRHAYSILEARTVLDGLRLLKVRNPWGESEWEGDWSDRSKKWTDELKKLLKHEDKDDGIFWISYEDLLRNYPHLHRTRIFDDSWTVAQTWTNFTVPLLSSDTYEKTFKVTLTKAATTAIVLSQLDERYFRGLTGQYEFGLSFRLHKLDDDDYLYRCHHRHFDDRSINLEVDLEAGVYEVRLKVTSERYSERPKIEDVVRINWKDSREKLLQICRSYDLAHAKVAAPELQVTEFESKDSLKKLGPEVKSVNENPGAKQENPASNKIGEPKSESKSAGSAEEASADKKVADSDSKPEERAEEAKGEAEQETESKSKTSEPGQSGGDIKAKAPLEGTHQDHRSDTDTASTEPEIIEKSDFKPEAENGGKETKVTSDVEAKDIMPGDATAQTESLHDQATAAKSPTKTPFPSTTQAEGVAQPATEISAADKTTSSSNNIQSDHYKNCADVEGMHDQEPRQKAKIENEAPQYLNPTDNPPAEEKDKGKDQTKEDADKKEKEEEDKHKPTEPFNSVCTVGLRVYCINAKARIELIRPSTALVQDKQFTSSKESEMDVDDPAKS